MFEEIYDHIVEAVSGKNWYWRLGLLVYLAYIFIRHLLDPFYSSALGGINLGVHELGHFVFAPFGQFLGVAGGTILEILMPVIGMLNFIFLVEDYFALTLCFGWLSTALFDVARYAADAQAMQLPLVSPFGSDTVVHDWNFMLGRLGILDYDVQVGLGIKIIAIVSMAACFILGGWLIVLMIANKDARHASAGM